MTAEPKDETLTIRLPSGAKARLEALAAQRRVTREDWVEVTITSLARGAVLRMLDAAEKAKGRRAGR